MERYAWVERVLVRQQYATGSSASALCAQLLAEFSDLARARFEVVPVVRTVFAVS
jgi:hypothetical protein